MAKNSSILSKLIHQQLQLPLKSTSLNPVCAELPKIKLLKVYHQTKKNFQMWPIVMSANPIVMGKLSVMHLSLVLELKRSWCWRSSA